jgi:5-oxopent-3-ene-1,2,5-tricarboxylate decarboxylase/2-hydroxyhepta-2,4-diene-1,7-dioate isomerase
MSIGPAERVDVPVAPYRLSGNVIGVLLNHAPALAALGDAVRGNPYRAPPKAPVLYLKPRNTQVGCGGTVEVPDDVPQLEIGASLAAMIGTPACRVSAERALEHVAGYLLLADLCIPHGSYYRPSLRWRVRDGFCPLGPAVLPRDALADPDDLMLTVAVDGQPLHQASTGDRVRTLATLIQDISAFMTLQPGDLLMLGVAHGAPLAGAGQRVHISAPGLGSLHFRLVAPA